VPSSSLRRAPSSPAATSGWADQPGDRLGRTHRAGGANGRARRRSSRPSRSAASGDGDGLVGPSVVVANSVRTVACRPSPVTPATGSVLDRVIDRCGLTVPAARSLLAKFRVGSRAPQPTEGSVVTGRTDPGRAAMFQARQVNFLVLDEPTNHLDVPAVEQIEEALSGFGGTVLLVSHDRRLLDAVSSPHATHRFEQSSAGGADTRFTGPVHRGGVRSGHPSRGPDNRPTCSVGGRPRTDRWPVPAGRTHGSPGATQCSRRETPPA